MGMYGVLCTLSAKRQELLEGEPELVEELVASRHEGSVPGLLDLGKSWDALSRLLADTGADEAITLDSGKEIGPALSYGPARMIPAKQVAVLAGSLPADPVAFVRERFAVLGGGEGVHGGLGRDETDREQLGRILERVCDLYRGAARDGHGMLAVVL
jgi:hypothetical protein